MKYHHVLPKLRLLWARRQVTLYWALAGCCAAIVVAFAIPTEYVSTAKLMPPDSQSGVNLAMQALAGGFGSIAGDLLGVKTNGALFIRMMRSRTVEDRIVQKFDLKKVYWTTLQQTARRHLEANTDISADLKSGVITLVVTDNDPQRAAGIAGAYIEQLQSLMAQLNTSSAHRERAFLEERLETIKVDLQAAENDLGQFASNHGTFDIADEGQTMLGGVTKLQGRIMADQAQLEELRQTYSDNNPRVRSFQAGIAELRDQQSKLVGTYNAHVSGDENASSSSSYPALRQLPILGAPYADKLRHLKVEEAIYDTLIMEFESSKVQEAREIPSVSILDPPQVPERKSFPPRLLIISMGTTCPAILGALWVLGVAYWREIDPLHPGRVLAQEIFESVRSRIPGVAISRVVRSRSADSDGRMREQSRAHSG